MKNVLERNCFKKVKANKQKKAMVDMGMNAYVEKSPKLKLSMHKTQSPKVI
ncbi:hypothetical protein ABXS75_19760 [Roseburia hominis]